MTGERRRREAQDFRRGEELERRGTRFEVTVESGVAA
jgi:hypothetical protein